MSDKWKWLISWWPLVLSIIFVIIGLGFALGLDLVDKEAARWTLSALVQSGAAIVGIFFVILGLLWTQANQETNRLTDLRDDYLSTICPAFNTILKSFIITLANTLGDTSLQDDTVKKTLRICCVRISAISQASVRYFNQVATPNIEDDIKEQFGIEFTDEEMEMIERDEYRIINDIFGFFDELSRLDAGITILLRRGRGDWGNHVKCRKSDFYTQILHKSRHLDRVYGSLWKLRFVSFFRGTGLVLISVLWLVSITLGLLISFSLGRMNIVVLPYIAAVPLGLGIIALGTTLSFIIRAVSEKE